MASLLAAFAPARVERHALERGRPRRDEGDRPRRRPRRADAAAFRPHAQAAARGARQAADRLAPRGARRRRGARGRRSIPPGWRSRSSPRSATARASASPSPTRWKGATTAAPSRPPAASPRPCRCSATCSGSSPPTSTRPAFATSRPAHDAFVASGRLGRLWLVPNPNFHPDGDFGLGADGLGLAEGTGPDGQRWTYANIALLRAEMFAGIVAGTQRQAGAPALRRHAGAADRRRGLARPLGERRHAGAAGGAQRLGLNLPRKPHHGGTGSPSARRLSPRSRC